MGQNAKIDQIKFDRANANKGSERGRYMLEASMREFGFADAGTIDRNNTIIGGNKRTEVAGEIGMDDIVIIDIDGTKPVYIRRNDLDLNDPDDDRARRLAYMLNRSQQVSLEWDTEQLLADIGAGLDLSAMFRDDELNELLAELRAQDTEPVDAEPQIDRAEELRAKWGAETGSLWLLDSGKGHPHRLICGDCTDADVVARLMDGERAQLAWFDPPFGIDLQPQRKLTRPIANDGRAEAQALWTAFLPLLYECMSPDTNLFLCQDWAEFEWCVPMVRRHFAIKSKVVWNKNVWGIGYYTRPKHEDILYCWKGEPSTPDEPVADVWDVARSASPDHAAEKPPGLSAIAIEHFSKCGNVVVDWFCGVGGSIIACESLNRQCRAIEISPSYCAVILERWATATGGTPQRVE